MMLVKQSLLKLFEGNARAFFYIQTIFSLTCKLNKKHNVRHLTKSWMMVICEQALHMPLPMVELQCNEFTKTFKKIIPSAKDYSKTEFVKTCLKAMLGNFDIFHLSSQ